MKINNIGVNIKDVDLFEGQYIVPNGMAYNSYLLQTTKTIIFDTVEISACEIWLDNIKNKIGDNCVDYLIISHMEPDHSACILKLIQRYPDVKIIGNAKTFVFLNQFFGLQQLSNKIVVTDGEEMKIGECDFKFFTAPMVHWPEVMMTYEASTKSFFSADAFGKFGTIDTDEDWACEARRYYFNIVGKYGVQVQSLFKKINCLDISAIYPLHGPTLDKDLSYYLNLYDTWSLYKPEKDGVFIAYSSVYGNTKRAALQLEQELMQNGIAVSLSDLARSDMAENIEDAFKYSKLVLATTTYDGGLFPIMDEFISHLLSKGFKNRTLGIIENGTWAPMVENIIKGKFATSKNINFTEQTVSIKSALSDKNFAEIKCLAHQLSSN